MYSTLKAFPRLVGCIPGTMDASVLKATVCITFTAFSGNLQNTQSSFFMSDVIYNSYNLLQIKNSLYKIPTFHAQFLQIA